MKRSFHHLDSCIPKDFLDATEGAESTLERMRSIEHQLHNTSLSLARKYHSMYCEPEMLPKILRVFVRHSLSSESDGTAYYTLHIEGSLLEHTQYLDYSLGALLSQVEVTVQDIKSSSEAIRFEWNSGVYPQGRVAQCFRFKIPSQESEMLIARISLLKSSLLRQRYELSPALRAFLPTLPEDPCEDEILFCMWWYILANNLVEGRERKVVRCDAGLKSLFTADVFVASSLKHRLKPHLTPAKPILFDYVLSPESSIDLKSSSKGKCFDLEVHVSDPTASRVNQALIQYTEQRAVHDSRIEKAECIVRSMRRKAAIDALKGKSVEGLIDHFESESKKLRSTYLLTDSASLLNSHSFFADTSGKLIRLPPQHTSCIHDLAYFIDVSSDRVFSAEDDSWVNKVATQVINDKSKQQTSISAEAKADQS